MDKKYWTFFEFVCKECKQSIKRRSDKKDQSMICRPCNAKKLNLSHGESRTRIYRIWKGMRERCFNPNRKPYKNYGGRGISVCEEWNSYLVFKDWAINHGYSDYLSIERIDVNGNYCPENCTWIPLEDQSKNRRKRL